ncbi:MAG TPA: KamA family radical SAM protein [Anaerohalosphaeraceae bacterium]|nr:KamA family radical SAM protein [Anaerohalosphaeraceae bacterium]
MKKRKLYYYTDVRDLPQLSAKEKGILYPVAEQYSFRANDYYLSLINWDDPADPIRRLIIPDLDELESWGRLDPSNEQNYTILPGLEHKYNTTALMLVSNVCEGICRYCFRKRVFIHPQKDVLRDLPAAIDYIRNHKEITNILLTGGDPLVLTTGKLEKIIGPLREISHVQIIRIGTRVPVFNPYRILNDPDLPLMLGRYCLPDKKIYIMTHFIHPRELTTPALEAVHRLQKAGAILCNQSPLIRGVNDKPSVLAQLMRRCSFAGIVPYYLFQCRPALGNRAYTVPIEEGYDILGHAKAMVSGLAKRLRFVMSHSTGKLEIIGRTDEYTYFKYHRAADDKDSGRILICRSNPQACWLDDYEEITQDYRADQPYHLYGPE